MDVKYPLLNFCDHFDQLGKYQYFTTIDLESEFYPIEIKRKDIVKPAFAVENGHFEFVISTDEGPTTYQRVMDNILVGIHNERCLVYMDDIFSRYGDIVIWD